MNSYFSDGFRDKLYFVICPLCKGDENINCEICFNERRRLFYIPALPLKSITIVWSGNTAGRIVHFTDSSGMFTLELDKEAWTYLNNNITGLEELSCDFVPSNSGKDKNELIIELDEIDQEQL